MKAAEYAFFIPTDALCHGNASGGLRRAHGVALCLPPPCAAHSVFWVPFAGDAGRQLRRGALEVLRGPGARRATVDLKAQLQALPLFFLLLL